MNKNCFQNTEISYIAYVHLLVYMYGVANSCEPLTLHILYLFPRFIFLLLPADHS